MRRSLVPLLPTSRAQAGLMPMLLLARVLLRQDRLRIATLCALNLREVALLAVLSDDTGHGLTAAVQLTLAAESARLRLAATERGCCEHYPAAAQNDSTRLLVPPLHMATRGTKKRSDS